jgi:hypothetical protein
MRPLWRIGRPLAGCAAVLAMGVLLAGGCALRTPGGIRVDQRSVDTAAGDPDIRKLPPGPSPGASPAAIVRGFVEAAAADSDRTFAQVFLVPGTVWSDRYAASVYAPDSVAPLEVTVAGPVSRVRMTAQGLAALSSGGAFFPDARPLTENFELRRIGGQWRLSHVPPGVLLTPRDLARGYRSVRAYGFNPAGSLLVAEPGYVAADRAGLAGATLHALLTRWGSPGGAALDTFQSLLPGLTALGSVVVRDGEATVDLGREAFAVPPGRRALLISQIAASLGSVPGVFTVRVLVEQRPYVAGAVAAQIPAALVAASAGPAFAIAPDGGLEGLTDGHAQRVRWIARQPRATTRAGASQPGLLSNPIAAPAGRELAVLRLSAQGPQLVFAALTDSAHPTAAERIAVGLKVPRGPYLRPQWLDDGRLLLAVGGSSPRLQVVTVAGAVHQVSSPGLSALGPLSAFAVSQDGTRAVAVAGPAGARRAYLGRIRSSSSAASRLAGVIADGWTPVATSMSDISAVGWSDDLAVTVLGRAVGSLQGSAALRAVVVALATVSDPAQLPPLPPAFTTSLSLPEAVEVATAPGRAALISVGSRRWMLQGGRWVVAPAGTDAAYS